MLADDPIAVLACAHPLRRNNRLTLALRADILTSTTSMRCSGETA